MDHTSLWMFGLLLGLQIPWLALLMNHLNCLHLCFLFWLFRDAFRIHCLFNWWIFLAVNMFRDAQLKDPLYQGHIFPAVFAVFYLSDITTFCKVVPRGLCGLLCNFRCLFALKLKLDGATLILFCMYHPSVLVWGECLLQLQCSIFQRTFVHEKIQRRSLWVYRYPEQVQSLNIYKFPILPSPSDIPLHPTYSASYSYRCDSTSCAFVTSSRISASIWASLSAESWRRGQRKRSDSNVNSKYLSPLIAFNAVLALIVFSTCFLIYRRVSFIQFILFREVSGKFKDEIPRNWWHRILLDAL